MNTTCDCRLSCGPRVSMFATRASSSTRRRMNSTNGIDARVIQKLPCEQAEDRFWLVHECSRHHLLCTVGDVQHQCSSRKPRTTKIREHKATSIRDTSKLVSRNFVCHPGTQLWHSRHKLTASFRHSQLARQPSDSALRGPTPS